MKIKNELKDDATAIWKRVRRGGYRPNREEYKVVLAAYWASLLPWDPDYSVSQWVEDGMPEL